MGTGPSKMDHMRLKLFERALCESTGGVIEKAYFEQLLCERFGLDESGALDVVCKFLSYNPDMNYYFESGIIQYPPGSEDHRVMMDLVEMSCGGLIHAHPYEVMRSDLFEEERDTNVSHIPICKRGVAHLELAVRSGTYVMFYVTPRTSVYDVIEFVKGIELLEVPPELMCAQAA